MEENTVIIPLALSCITFTVGQFITYVHTYINFIEVSGSLAMDS